MSSIFRTASGFFFHANNENDTAKKILNDLDTNTDNINNAVIGEPYDGSLQFVPAEAHLIQNNHDELAEEEIKVDDDDDNNDNILWMPS